MTERYGNALGLIALLLLGDAHAEIVDANSPLIRVRLGDNGRGAVATVEYEAGIPGALGGLPGVTAAPHSTSVNAIPGGSGAYTVRIETDVNAKAGISFVEGTFSYDSSQPMTCITPATCGGAAIPMTRISWLARDGDAHASVLQYDGTANQVTAVHSDVDGSRNGSANRYRNFLQFRFDNSELLPAGTYEGTVTLNASGQFQ